MLLVQETVAARKASRRAERDALGRGEMPDTLKDWRVRICIIEFQQVQATCIGSKNKEQSST